MEIFAFFVSFILIKLRVFGPTNKEIFVLLCFFYNKLLATSEAACNKAIDKVTHMGWRVKKKEKPCIYVRASL